MNHLLVYSRKRSTLFFQLMLRLKSLQNSCNYASPFQINDTKCFGTWRMQKFRIFFSQLWFLYADSTTFFLFLCQCVIVQWDEKKLYRVIVCRCVNCYVIKLVNKENMIWLWTFRCKLCLVFPLSSYSAWSILCHEFLYMLIDYTILAHKVGPNIFFWLGQTTHNNFVILPYRVKRAFYGEQLSCSCILATCMVVLLGNVYTITTWLVYRVLMLIGFMTHKMNCFTALN